MKSLIKHSQITLIVIFIVFFIFLLNYWFSLYMNYDNSASKYSIIEGYSSVDYRGKLDKTISGKTCQYWSSQKPHKHTRLPSNFPGKGLNSVRTIDGVVYEDHNYCRNPDGERDIWCYTEDPDKRWEFCDSNEARKMETEAIEQEEKILENRQYREDALRQIKFEEDTSKLIHEKQSIINILQTQVNKLIS